MAERLGRRIKETEKTIMTIYSHKVQYYETDKMQITHHSNYVRFMEEARVKFLDDIGYGYLRMEHEGVISPVVSVNLQFKKPTTFGDMIDIAVGLKAVTPVKTEFAYIMTCRGKVVCLAESIHCFVDKSGRPVSLKHKYPELYELLQKIVEAPSDKN